MIFVLELCLFFGVFGFVPLTWTFSTQLEAQQCHENICSRFSLETSVGVESRYSREAWGLEDGKTSARVKSDDTDFHSWIHVFCKPPNRLLQDNFLDGNETRGSTFKLSGKMEWNSKAIILWAASPDCRQPLYKSDCLWIPSSSYHFEPERKNEAPSERSDGIKLDKVSMLNCSMHWEEIRMQNQQNADPLSFMPGIFTRFTLRTLIHITLCYHWRATTNDRGCFSSHREYMNRLENIGSMKKEELIVQLQQVWVHW